MKIIDLVQRSPEWFEARRGKPSASSFDKIITNEGKPSKTRTKYMYTLAAEMASGLHDDTFQSQAMLQGIEREDTARKFYELIRGVEVKEVGLCLSDDEKYLCSPDGLIGDNGGMEIKCPLGGTHVGYIMQDDEVPLEYFTQVQGNLLVTQREWWDFVSYYPSLKPVIVREEPNTVFQRLLKKELDLFCEDLEKLVKQLTK